MIAQMKDFNPRLDVLPVAQRRLWSELSAVPDEFVLYGGTALALHLGHRTSIDFDFFSRRSLDLDSLQEDIPFMVDARILQREKKARLVVAAREVNLDGLPQLDGHGEI